MTNQQEIVQELLIKTKQRVSEHGEVFTPRQTVVEMLDLVKEESSRIDSRFLEPACGEGNFLKEVLARKLSTVQVRFAANEFERKHYALLGLMSIYGIELLDDNVRICRENLAEMFKTFINESNDNCWEKAATVILNLNIVQADALTMKTPNGDPLTFPEWGYLGKGKYQRRDFEYGDLTQRSSFIGTLFEETSIDQIFKSKSVFRPMSVVDISEGANLK